MEDVRLVSVAGFPLALDRCYEPETHMWVLSIAPARVRIGMNSLGVETSGTLAQLSLVSVGSELVAGRPFGQLEAAKFVGPLTSPVSGTVVTVNDDVVLDPGLAERDPYEQGWLIEVELVAAPGELSGLVSDPAEITAWFTAKIAAYRLKGVLAE